MADVYKLTVNDGLSNATLVEPVFPLFSYRAKGLGQGWVIEVLSGVGSPAIDEKRVIRLTDGRGV
jgi:hypothetical protein